MFAIVKANISSSKGRVAAPLACLRRQCGGVNSSPSFFSPRGGDGGRHFSKPGGVTSADGCHRLCGVAPPSHIRTGHRPSAPLIASPHDRYSMPRRFASSSSSSNEIVVPDPAPPPPPHPTTTHAAHPPADGTSTDERRSTTAASDRRLRQSEELLARMSELAALAADSARGTSDPTEVVAAADGLLALASSPAFGRAASLTAPDALHGLHRAFLTVAERCVGSALAVAASSSSTDGASAAEWSSAVVASRRALDLSRRAEELGLPLHRPFYRRLALGLVATSTASPGMVFRGSEAAGGIGDEATDEGSAAAAGAPDLPSELLTLCARAYTVLCGPKADPQEVAAYLLEEPFVDLVKRKRLDEALRLAQGMNHRFGMKHISEAAATEVAEILKLGLEDSIVTDENASGDGDENISLDLNRKERNRCIMELLNIVYTSLINTASERKAVYRDWNRALSDYGAFLNPHESGDENGKEDSTFDEHQEDFEDEDYDSDDDNAHGEYGPADLDERTGDTENLSKLIAHLNKNSSVPISVPGTMEANVFDSPTGKISINEWDDDTESLDGTPEEESLVEGLTNKETRECIYVRNHYDWDIPDVLPQLAALNGDKEFRFTRDYEKRLGRQICNDDEWDDYDLA